MAHELRECLPDPLWIVDGGLPLDALLRAALLVLSGIAFTTPVSSRTNCTRRRRARCAR